MVLPVIAVAARGAAAAATGASRAAAAGSRAGAGAAAARSAATGSTGSARTVPPKGKHRSRKRGWSKYDQVKYATKLALEDRKKAEEGEFSTFLPALVFAIAKDFFFDAILLFGTLFGIFITTYLFIFLWGKGKWKVRIVIFFLSMLDLIPAVNLIPFSTICVLYAYHQARKNVHKTKTKLAVTRATA